jgi:hypothetical protein
LLFKLNNTHEYTKTFSIVNITNYSLIENRYPVVIIYIEQVLLFLKKVLTTNYERCLRYEPKPKLVCRGWPRRVVSRRLWKLQSFLIGKATICVQVGSKSSKDIWSVTQIAILPSLTLISWVILVHWKEFRLPVTQRAK